MIYLDNAATTFPKPQQVVKSVVEAVRVYGGNPGRGGHSASMRASEQVFRVREAAGRFFGVGPERVVFASNCTHALNLAINLLGAYVHTNRLQFVEFFGKFYEGGGKPFEPFCADTKYVDIKEET